MKDLKGWPFEPSDGLLIPTGNKVEPCNGVGNGPGPGVPG